MAILGSCWRLASPTSFMVPWHTAQSTFLSTCTLWLKTRWAVGSSSLAGSRRTVASKPGWHVLHEAGGSVLAPLRAASMS